MHKTKTFHKNQQGVYTDFNELQTFAQDTFDYLTYDAVTSDNRFAGMLVTQGSSTSIDVAVGRYYKAGEMFSQEDAALNIDFLGSLPLSTKKYVAVVVSGSEAADDAEQRKFLIDAVSRATQVQNVSTASHRAAVISTVASTEGADPVKPSAPAGSVVVAWVKLGTGGVEVIEMNTDAALESIQQNDVRLTSLEDWRTKAGTRIETLSTDLSALAQAQAGNANQVMFEQLVFDVARVRELFELPSAYNDYGAEFFLHTEDLDTLRGGFDCEVSEGLTFPDDAADVGLIALFNPTDPLVQTYASGMVLPKFTEETRIQATGVSGSVALTEYSVRTWGLVRRHWSRFRRRWGNRVVRWRGEHRLTVLKRTQTGPNGEPPGTQYPVAPLVFRKEKSGELETVFKDSRTIKADGRVVRDRKGRWHHARWWTEPYWRQIQSNISVDGAGVAQTFLNSQDGYLTSVDVYFVTKGVSGDVHLQICECNEQGAPDPSAVLSSSTLAYDDINVAADGLTPTNITFDPVLMESGKRYAFFLITQGAHWLALASQVSYNAGALFKTQDGVFFVGSLTDDLKFDANFALFNSSHLTVTLDALSLSGGITDISLISEGYVPDGTSLTFEVKPSGGSWTPLAGYADEITSGPLTSLPVLLEFRAVFSGTRELMPNLNLASTEQYISRPKTAFTAMTNAIALSAGCQNITAKVILDEFDETPHDCTVELEDVTNNPGTWVAAGTTTDVQINDHQVERTLTWVLGVASTSIAFRIVGATTAATSMYRVEEISYVAQT